MSAQSNAAAGGSPTGILLIRFYAVFLVLVGGLLAIGGIKLALAGGAYYYLLSGAVLIASGILLWSKRRLGAWLYGLFFVATLGWAVWEVGGDGWALLPRIAAPAVVGLWLLMPIVRRNLVGQRPLAQFDALVTILVAGIVAIAAGAGFHALQPQSSDPIFQTGTTSFTATPLPATSVNSNGNWQHYGNDQGGSRFSGLDQITLENVRHLKVAWTTRVGYSVFGEGANFEATPIKVGESLYLCKSDNEVIALNAETGEIRWRFNPKIDPSGLTQAVACRGVSYYRVPEATGACAERIITNTVDARLIALDAATGELCRDFGTNGVTSLLTGMGDVGKGYYYVSSAPTIVRGKVVLGGWVSDNQYWGEPSGVIRAYDVVTGKFAWAFDMGRPDRQTEPPAGEDYTRSTPNSWAPMSADEDLGLVYAPTGNATPDWYGASRRSFDDQYSSSVVALDAETGKPRWSFQTTHHDLWDYDVPSQPTLADIQGPNGVEKILVQATKRGELFVLDRRTGVPLANVVEHPVPQGGAPGERLSPTQPYSDGMPSTRGPNLRERDMWGVTPLDQMWCRIEFKKTRYDGHATPPGLEPTLSYPGSAGGTDWGSVSIDPDRGILITNALRMAMRVQLVPRAVADQMNLKPLTVETAKRGVAGGPQAKTPYGILVAPFLSPLQVPCQRPPYGTISGIDLRTHKLLWTQPFGTARESGPFHIPSMLPITMGVPNWGGSITTRGGLTFIAASQDRYIRAFDTATGKLLWQSFLPAGGGATPLSYLSTASGRQFVVIVAGGSYPIQSKFGDYIVAFALPSR